MASEGKSLTRRVLSGSGVMGGTQIFTILCSIIRSKLVALWIGPAGFGLMAIFNSATELLTQITSLGIRGSAVRNVAASTGNAESTARIVHIVSRWGLWLGLLGLVVTTLLSPVLSIISFGSMGYTGSFILIGVAVFLNTFCGAQMAILQGLRRLNRLSRATVSGAVAGLVITAPLYYLLRLDSIVLGILVYSAVTALAIWHYRERPDDTSVKVSRADIKKEGSSMIRLGFFITLSDVINQLAVYIFVSWLNARAGGDVVGYYQAGNTLFNRYVSVVFTAIAMEYYPRLASRPDSVKRTSVFVAHEMKLAVWILFPVVLCFIAALPLIIRILYLSDFLVIAPFVSIAIVGTIFRAVSWCMAMVILARGDGKTFIISEGLSAVTAVTANVLAYRLAGLVGLGFSYVAWYMVYTAIVAVIYRRRYHMSLNLSVLVPVVVSLAVTSAVAAVTIVTGLYWPAIVATVVVSPIAFYVLKKS